MKSSCLATSVGAVIASIRDTVTPLKYSKSKYAKPAKYGTNNVKTGKTYSCT